MLRENPRLLNALVSPLPGPEGLFDAVTHGIIVGDRQGRVVYCNEAALAMHGFDSREQVAAMTLETLAQSLEFRDATGRLVPMQEWPLVMAARGLAVDGEFAGAHPERGLRWVARYSARPVMNSDGMVTLVVVTVQDITDLRRADQAVSETADRYRTLYEGAPIGIERLGLDGRIIEANEVVARMLGTRRENLVGVNFEDITHPEDVPAEKSLLGQLYAGEIDHYTMEKRYLRSDGQALWVRVTSALVGGGRGPYRTSFIEDLGELKRTQATLRNSERIYRAIGESIDYGVWVCAPDGRNLYASQSFLDLVGITQEQCSDFGWGDVLHPDDAERTIAAWKECVRTQGTWDIEHRYRGVDGKWHDILARGIPVKDERGDVVCWAGINLDIRSQKQAQAELKEAVVALAHANHELEAFSYSVSHDLRAPVRAIEGFAAMLAESEGEILQSDSQRYLDRIRCSSLNLGRLIDGLLVFARVGQQEMHLASVPMESLVHAAWEECRDTAGERRLELRLASPLPPARGDPLLLHQVLVNLLGNAIKYSASRDVIVVEVGAEKSTGETVYYVRDHGVGFDMRHVGKLFGVFQRLHAAHEFEGTGVGLALVRRIVERHGGRVWAQGAPGEGATFYFVLP